MPCKPCQAKARALAAAGGRGTAVNSGLEFVVFSNGEYSEPFPSYTAAAAHADQHGGQVRSRSKV